MSNRIFTRVLLWLVILCLALTVAHLIWILYAYQHCSIIEFIAKELW